MSHPAVSSLLSDAVPGGSRRAYVLSLATDDPAEFAGALRKMAKMVSEDMIAAEAGSNTSWEVGGAGPRDFTGAEALASVVFGEAGPSSVPDTPPAGLPRRLAPLLLLCTRPSSPPSTYAGRQAQSFLSYHLHKYASATNASLLFTDASGSGSAALRSYLSAVSAGSTPPVAAADAAAPSAPSGPVAPSDPPPARLYAPGSHLAPSVLETLRQSASCDGTWDAETDGIDAVPRGDATGGKKLPPSVAVAPTKVDEAEWLARLAESVRAEAPMLVEEGGRKSGVVPVKGGEAAKPPKKDRSNKDVSSFFENLLKK